MTQITIDFETRSAAKLKNVGGWMYSIHPTTQPICLSYSLEEDDEPKLWAPSWTWDIVGPWYQKNYGVPMEIDCPWLIPDSDFPADLAGALQERCEVEAHNAFFERAVWLNVMGPQFDWPGIPTDQWRCSAAKAATYALPRSLEGAVEAMGLPYPKDMAGNRLMMKLCRPRKPRKAEKEQLMDEGCTEIGDGYGWARPDQPEPPIYFWHEKPEDIYGTWEYCRQDVRAERALSRSLADLGPAELEVWRADQAINLRGVRIDRKMAESALEIAARAVDRATAEAIEAATVYHTHDDGTKSVAYPAPFETLGQRDKIKTWVEGQGVILPNMQGATIDQLLDGELPESVRTVLQCKRTASRTSVRKYSKMLDTCDPRDDRIRDVFMYHGAGTGRWTGRFVQTQNFVRGKMKDPDTMCGVIREGALDWLLACYGPKCPMELLSWALRGALWAAPGKIFYVADYSGVEARGLLWFVEDDEGLEIFRRPEGEPGIYREMAAEIYAKPAKAIANPSEERQMGKQAILGLGYGMGAPKFRATCASYGTDVDTEFAKFVVKAYRSRFHKVPQAWRDLEAAAIKAVRNPEQPFRVLKVTYLRKGKFLFCRLPSGRKIAYCSPSIVPAPTPWGEMRPKLTYMTVDGVTRKWARTDTYGGKLMENNIQGLCRDLEAHALITAERSPIYDTVMHTHDELVAECDEDKGDVSEFEELITQLPDWAEGFPLNAEGWRGKRYRK
jgi:DNA polymerase